MMQKARTVSFIATSIPRKSRHFYCELLGFMLVEETQYAIVLESVNASIRIQITDQVFPPPYTSLGWEVENIVKVVRSLSELGVRFERFKGLAQDDLGVWDGSGRAKVAWFKDPDGNMLSLTQMV